MTGLRFGKCGVGISAGSRLVPECPEQLFRASHPIQWYWKLFFTSKTAGAWGWPIISISCWGWEWVELQLRLFDFVVCTGTYLPVSLPFVYKMFIRVVQLSCSWSESSFEVWSSPYRTKQHVSVIMLIWLMDFLENSLCLFGGACLLSVRIALPAVL